MCMSDWQRVRQTHIRDSAGSRVGQGAGEGGYQGGFVCIVSIFIGHGDLQGDFLLVTEREHLHTIVPSNRQES